MQTRPSSPRLAGFEICLADTLSPAHSRSFCHITCAGRSRRVVFAGAHASYIHTTRNMKNSAVTPHAHTLYHPTIFTRITKYLGDQLMSALARPVLVVAYRASNKPWECEERAAIIGRKGWYRVLWRGQQGEGLRPARLLISRPHKPTPMHHVLSCPSLHANSHHNVSRKHNWSWKRIINSTIVDEVSCDACSTVSIPCTQRPRTIPYHHAPCINGRLGATVFTAD
ncbi:hypothetical protein BDQ17DRAFT_883699 [Cyathus striatus]|nr:hypothetical protein BDQ17DRAFT_883699 [Cyathus striatus]